MSCIYDWRHQDKTGTNAHGGSKHHPKCTSTENAQDVTCKKCTRKFYFHDLSPFFRDPMWYVNPSEQIEQLFDSIFILERAHVNSYIFINCGFLSNRVDIMNVLWNMLRNMPNWCLLVQFEMNNWVTYFRDMVILDIATLHIGQRRRHISRDILCLLS